MIVIGLRVKGSDGEQEFVIQLSDGILDIRRTIASRTDADRTAPLDIAHEHCPVCMKLPDEDCDGTATTYVLEVELLDG